VTGILRAPRLAAIVAIAVLAEGVDAAVAARRKGAWMRQIVRRAASGAAVLAGAALLAARSSTQSVCEQHE
jgi:hypothetical protein